MAISASSWVLACVMVALIFAHPTHAFGAGNIGSTAEIEGQNWRHGDIEDTLLTLLIARAAGGKKFSKLDVKRVYFGNWLRDYSQAVDVGTVKYVSAEAIRILLWVLGFLSFGYGTKEFEVTTARLGCYRPEEHIDNPKDYADNEDARQYDRRLRGPVDERRELAIDPQTGLKTYIASEGAGITTSAGLVRNLFGRCIQLGRQYSRSKREEDLFEALRLLGTGCHCLEDYSAHSNYTELALIELGERDVFPHVGRQTQIQLRGARHPVFPIVTGTFGGVDFLHSVMGELSDKTTQSEIQDLEGTISQSQNSGQDISVLQDLLSKLPDGMFGGEDQAGKASELQANAQAAQMQHARISPRQPEEWTRYLEDIQNQIRPILEFHDNLMKGITETIEKIPILPDLLDQLSDQISVFVFSLLAPFVLPIINQVKTELATGSSEIIKSSRDKQLIVFHDDRSSNPTHSMLSKDHFSNVLNEPAGRVASQVLKWVVPQIVAAMDDERIDVDRTLNRIIHGVLHHPALRDQGDDGAMDGRHLMFQVVEKWWRGKDERERQVLRDQLSRSGVEQGRNHKEGVHDSGHGCGKPLGLPNMKTSQSSGVGGLAASGVLGGLSALEGELGGGGRPGQSGSSSGLGNIAGEAVGGGALGGIVGGLVGGVGGSLLGGVFGGGDDEKKQYKKESYGQDGSYSQTYTEVGRHNRQSQGDENKWGQAQYTKTDYPTGGSRESYQRYEQDGGSGGGGYGVQETVESRPHGGGYERTTEKSRYEGGGGWQSEVKREEKRGSGEYRAETQRYGSGGGYGGRKSDDDDSDDEKKKNKYKKHHKKDSDDDSDDDKKKRQSGGGYGDSGYGGQQQRQSGGYGETRREEYGSGGGYGETRREEYGSGGGYGESRREEYGSGGGYGGQQRESYGESRAQEYGGGYGGQQERMPGGFGESEREETRGGYGGQSYGESRREEYGSGGGYGGQEREEDGENKGDEYGSGGGYGQQESGGYGQDEEGYGERRPGYGNDY